MHSRVKHPKRNEEKGDRNEEKLLAYLLFLFPLVASASHAQAETIKVVFDTAYAPFEFKDSDQTYKGIDVEILDKVAGNQWLGFDNPSLDLMQRSMQFKLVKRMPSWPGWPKQQNVKSLHHVWYLLRYKSCHRDYESRQNQEVQPIKREDSRC